MDFSKILDMSFNEKSARKSSIWMLNGSFEMKWKRDEIWK
jgi:hypothetical protein